MPADDKSDQPGPSERNTERARLREVAEAAGVAISSVSRVLSDHPDVSPKMRASVLSAASALGYERNLLWSGLRGGATKTIGVVLRDITSSLLSKISLGAEQTLLERGYSILLSNTRGESRLDVQHIRLLDQRRVDGLLLQPNDVNDAATLAAIDKLRVPFVAIDRDMPSKVGGGAVLIDHAGGVSRSLSYLGDMGHTAVGLIAPPRTSRVGRELVSALEHHGHDRGIAVVYEHVPFSGEGVAVATQRVLDSSPRPTALLAGSNVISPGVLLALQQQGIRIPEDLSFIAFDDHPLLSCMSPPISVVERSPLLVGQTAAHLLLELIAGGRPTVAHIQTEFILRTSCGPPNSAR